MQKRDFNEIYTKLVKIKKIKLIILQITKFLLYLLFFVLIILFVFTFPYMMENTWLATIFIATIILEFTLYILVCEKYKKNYRTTVIEALVKNYSENLIYNSVNGVSSSEYKVSNFSEHYSGFFSENLIQGNIDNEFNIKMSEVKVQVKVSDGYSTVFDGLYGFVDLSNMKVPNFYVLSNMKEKRYDNSRIEIDSAEFEKNYDLYSDDKIRTMKIFTSDLVEEFIRARKELKAEIQLKVNCDKLYFRISRSKLFEPPDFGNIVNSNLMHDNFKLIDNPIRLISKIIENTRGI